MQQPESPEVDARVERSAVLEVAQRLAAGCVARLRIEEARLASAIEGVERARETVERAVVLVADAVRAFGRDE